MTRRWHEHTLLCVDTETTSADPTTARLVTYAAVVLTPDGRVAQEHHAIVNPGVNIPDEAAKIHGVTTARAQAEGEPPAAALTTLLALLELAAGSAAAVVAYNAPFDLTVIAAETERHAEALGPAAAALLGELGAARVLDPLVIDEHVSRRRGSRRLADTAAYYGVTLDDWHAADADALAAGRIAQAIAKQERGISHLTLDEMHATQAEWAASRASRLRAYYQREGRAEDAMRVLAAWPMRPAGGQA